MTTMIDKLAAPLSLQRVKRRAFQTNRVHRRIKINIQKHSHILVEDKISHKQTFGQDLTEKE